ncbi:MAG TPA: flagellar M-ring protein FliF C-terminal domain-containing protein, partial [Casimicrobiaceae bacterium]|nr:flagellar M-ring protein FliF C-terminal domain-containing protein [Casimicrobiaceae bacterium]
VAVLVNDRQVGTGDSARFEKRPAEEIARLDTLVRNAVGFDSARGDQVSVVSVPFAIPALPTPAVEPPPTMLQKVQQNQSLIMNAAALVFAFVIGFMSLRSLRGTAPSSPAPALTASAQLQLPHVERFDPTALPAAQAPDSPVEDPSRAIKMLPELAALQANQETKQRVAMTVEKQPEIATKMMRAWLKEA